MGREGRGLRLRLQLRFNAFARHLTGFAPGQHRVVLCLLVEVLERFFDVLLVLLLFFRGTKGGFFRLFCGDPFCFQACGFLRFRSGFCRGGSGSFRPDLLRGLCRCNIFFQGVLVFVAQGKTLLKVVLRNRGFRCLCEARLPQALYLYPILY